MTPKYSADYIASKLDYAVLAPTAGHDDILDGCAFVNKYKNRVVFNNKRDLFSTINRIIDEDYNPLDEIEPVLKDYDQFRDEMGLERFREALR